MDTGTATRFSLAARPIPGLRALAPAAALALCASGAAQPIPITDPGFEQHVLSPCAFVGSFAGSGWTLVSGEAGIWRPGTCWDIVAVDGAQVAFSNGGVAAQTLTADAVPSQTYTLSVLLGRRNHSCCPWGRPTVELLAGSTLLGGMNVGDAAAPSPGKWLRYSFTVTAPSSLPASRKLTIRFKSASQADFDAFMLTAGCPVDFNQDGFVTGDDFDEYVAVFIDGDISADFNADGFVTGDDFDAFVAAFERGC